MEGSKVPAVSPAEAKIQMGTLTDASMAQAGAESSRFEDYQVIFALLDRERAGYIDAPDMAAVLRSSGRTEREAGEAVVNADANGEGSFGFEAFRALVESSLSKTTFKLAARQILLYPWTQSSIKP
ncbi:hypothetical protein T492DRAFT_835561 [Pavlovales sp. CCMP2436]|nr:hypothetical protein T492DRAFT_835561 [Pavlovales sp. CCMP2436]